MYYIIHHDYQFHYVDDQQPRYAPSLQNILRKIKDPLHSHFRDRFGITLMVMYVGSTLIRILDQGGMTHILSYDEFLDLYIDI